MLSLHVNSIVSVNIDSIDMPFLSKRKREKTRRYRLSFVRKVN